MTNEEKMIIKKYFEKCGAEASESCLDRIEKEDLTSDFLNYAKNEKKLYPGDIYTIVAYGGF